MYEASGFFCVDHSVFSCSIRSELGGEKNMRLIKIYISKLAKGGQITDTVFADC